MIHKPLYQRVVTMKYSCSCADLNVQLCAAMCTFMAQEHAAVINKFFYTLCSPFNFNILSILKSTLLTKCIIINIIINLLRQNVFNWLWNPFFGRIFRFIFLISMNKS